MHERGARLEKPGASTPDAGPERFTVDVEVHAVKGAHSYAARIEVQGTTGTRDLREVEADRCEELHSATAWVLVVLARGPRGSDEPNSASDATTESVSAPSGATPVAAAGSLPASSTLGGPSNSRALDEISSKVALVYGRVAVKAHPRFALGAQVMGGWGFLSAPAWGPAVFFEHRPLRTLPLTLRLTALTITNDGSSSDSSIGVAVRRTSARLGVALGLPKLPFAFTGGLEAGSLSARGSGAILSHEGGSFWGSAFAGILVDFPLLRDRLWLQAGADVSLAPFTYAFRTSSERTIVESGPVELRTSAGLKSSF